MIIHEGYDNLKIGTPVVTLGIFDGVHRGHRVLLDRLVLRSREAKGESVVITFSPHPRLVLEQNRTDLSFLTSMEEKKVLLGNTGIDNLVIIEFDDLFSRIPACDFIKQVLVEKIGTKHLLIGFNHHFGRGGEGDFNTIAKCSESLGFKVEQVQGYHTGEGAISSSSIRKSLLRGHLDEANRGLGYFYSITGTIVEGRRIGRSIGFPTANIRPGYDHKLIPGNGVYAVEAELDNRRYSGMLSIGTNPTVNKNSADRSIEVNILDFDKDIYGSKITVIFRKRLRDEITFKNTNELSEQMRRDKQQVMLLLS